MRDRAELVAAIQGGRTVLIGGRMVGRVEDLPTEAEFAAQSGDTERVDAVAADLQAQIDRMQAELAKLQPKGEISDRERELSRMTVPQLAEVAAKLGVVDADKLKKAQLIERITVLEAARENQPQE